MSLEEMIAKVESLTAEMENMKQEADNKLQTSEKEKDEIRIEADKLKEEIANLEKELSSVKSENEELEKSKTELEIKNNRIEFSTLKGANEMEKETYKKAFNEFLRKGITTPELVVKNQMEVSTPADGGYAVPDEFAKQVYDLVVPECVMRQVCNVITTSTGNFKQLVNTGGMASSWVAETAARPATNTTAFAEVTPFWGDLYALPLVSQWALDDIYFDVEDFIVKEIARQFGAAENNAFTIGTGTGQPKGIFKYGTAVTADGTRAFGTLQHVVTGVSGDFAATSASDIFFKTVAQLKSKHLPGAVWMMNRATLGTVMCMKNANGDPLFMPNMADGPSGGLVGYPVVVNDDMPNVAANSLSIAFGNFKNAYTITDRLGINLIRDPYSNKPNVAFYANKRVGGMLVDPEAVKVIKFSA